MPNVSESPARLKLSQAGSGLRDIAEKAFSRAAGAPLVTGNRIKLLRNGQENYPAWLEAISRAKQSVHFETYILHDDPVGNEFTHLLEKKAREGVRVRMILDWFGVGRTRWHKIWRSLRSAGAELRWFNPPRLEDPLSWFRRDHRKVITVDGERGFVGGLCVGQDWLGHPERGIEAWRDTGVQVEGPAVADLELAFRMMWASCEGSAPAQDLAQDSDGRPTAAGDVSLRVVAGIPDSADLYRLDQLIATLARDSIWLTDAYFVGTTPYIRALRAAALDGVDVRLLVPRTSDIPLLRALSRAGYRPLLEAGIRVFEWNGTMMHAKTAVADGRWSRIGSTNLNLVSWVGNWELDVVVENEQFGREMEEMFLQDLEHSTEIVLTVRRKVRPSPEVDRPARRRIRGGGGSASRTAVGVLRIGNAVSAAIADRRALGPAESIIMMYGAVALLIIAAVSLLWPLVIAIPTAVLGFWLAVALLIKAYRLRTGSGKS